MAFDPAKLKQLLSRRPRLLPLAVVASALAIPLYATAVVTRVSDAVAEVGGAPTAAVAATAPAQPPVAGATPAAAAAAPAAPVGSAATNGRPIPDGFTDLLAASGRPTVADATQGRCDPALAEMLAAERKAIADRQVELELRAQMLAAAEKKAAEQIARLEQARADVTTLLDRRASMAKADLQRLVSIYENMKPKDAARLLNETDPEILVDLLDLMQERRSAPILAEMDAGKVNTLTRTLALRRMLPGDRPLRNPAKTPPQTASLPRS